MGFDPDFRMGETRQSNTPSTMTEYRSLVGNRLN